MTESDGQGRRLGAVEAAKLQASLVTLAAQGLKGDKNALRSLARILIDREARQGFDAKTQNRILRKAFDALSQAEHHLGPQEFSALVMVSDEPEIGAAASDRVLQAARHGSGAALSALRSVARQEGPLSEPTIQLLAQCHGQLVDDDYRLIGPIGLRCTGDNPASSLLFEAARDGREGAVQVLREALLAEDDPDDAMQFYARGQAAKLLCEDLENFDASWLPRVVVLASKARVEDRVTLYEAVAMLASRRPPLAGAALAFVEISNVIPPKISFDEHEALRAVTRKYVVPAFEAAEDVGDLDGMVALAPLVMRRARGQDLALTAAELLYPHVLQGSPQALAALAETAGQPLVAGAEEACKLAVKMLEAAAKEGQAEAVIAALLNEIKRPGKNDDARALEALGRAARHLDRNHPLNKKVRSALRKCIKNYHPMRTTGHVSALKGMLAIADRLRDRDLGSLMDNLGPQAGQVLAAAAAKMPRLRLLGLQEQMQKRLDQGISVKGAKLVMQEVSRLLGAADQASRQEETQVLARQKKPIQGRNLQQILAETDKRDRGGGD